MMKTISVVALAATACATPVTWETISVETIKECITLCRGDAGLFQVGVSSTYEVRCECHNGKIFRYDESELYDDQDIDDVGLDLYPNDRVHHDHQATPFLGMRSTVLVRTRVDRGLGGQARHYR